MFSLAVSVIMLTTYRVTSTLDNDTDVTLSDRSSETPPPVLTTPAIIWQEYSAAKVGVELGTYASPVILIVGVVGNVLSIMVMMQKGNRNSSFAVYLSALALSDTGSLLTWAYRWYMMMIVGRGMGDLECKLDVGCKYAFRMAGYILILSLTADRYVVVRFPLRAADWSSPYRASYVSGAIFVASFAYATPYFVWGRQNKGYACVFIGSGNVYATYYMWSVVLFGLVLPFTLISFMNSVIVLTVRKRLQYRGKCSQHSTVREDQATTSGYVEEDTVVMEEAQIDISVTDKPASSAAGCKDCAVATKPLTRKDRNLVNILLLVTVFFLLFNSPQLIRVARSYVWDTKATLRMRANEYLAFQITNNLSNINYAINFFLYCLSGTKFRNDLAKLFKR